MATTSYPPSDLQKDGARVYSIRADLRPRPRSCEGPHSTSKTSLQYTVCSKNDCNYETLANICEVLNTSPEGNALVASFEENQHKSIHERRGMVCILISHLLEKREFLPSVIRLFLCV